MTIEQLTNQTDYSQPRRLIPSGPPNRTRRPRPGAAVIGLVVALAVLAVIAYHGAVALLGSTNPAVTGAPRPVRAVWAGPTGSAILQIGDDHHDGRLIVTVVLLAWRRHPRHPILLMVMVHDADRLAGPDHELGAVRGVQPAALALARRPGRLVSLSPTVEPFIVIGYVTFYLARTSRRSGSCVVFRPVGRWTRSSGATR